MKPVHMRRRYAVDGAKKPTKRDIIIDAIFKPLEKHGFRPSPRSVGHILRDVLKVKISECELREILGPFIEEANRREFQARTSRIGNFRRELKKSRREFQARTSRIEKKSSHAPDLPVRPKLINLASPHYHPPHTVPPKPDGAILNDEQVAAELAERAERFRAARELLAETERRNRALPSQEPERDESAEI